VVSGCIRNYELKGGEEKTWDLYTEGQTAANFQSLATGTSSKLNLVCIEETTISIVNIAMEQALYTKHPRFEAFCRSGLDQMMGKQQADMARFIKSSPEELYKSPRRTTYTC
jgi:hypothetical protein